MSLDRWDLFVDQFGPLWCARADHRSLLPDNYRLFTLYQPMYSKWYRPYLPHSISTSWNTEVSVQGCSGICQYWKWTGLMPRYLLLKSKPLTRIAGGALTFPRRVIGENIRTETLPISKTIAFEKISSKPAISCDPTIQYQSNWHLGPLWQLQLSHVKNIVVGVCISTIALHRMYRFPVRFILSWGQ